MLFLKRLFAAGWWVEGSLLRHFAAWHVEGSLLQCQHLLFAAWPVQLRFAVGVSSAVRSGQQALGGWLSNTRQHLAGSSASMLLVCWRDECVLWCVQHYLLPVLLPAVAMQTTFVTGEQLW